MLFSAIQRNALVCIYSIKYLHIHFRLIFIDSGNGEADDRTSNDNGRSENESGDDESDESEEGKSNVCLNLVTNHVFGSNDEHILL